MGDVSIYVSGIDAGPGKIPYCNDGKLSVIKWNNFEVMLRKSVNTGTAFQYPIVSTYNAIVPYDSSKISYMGGVLSVNNDVYFVPYQGSNGLTMTLSGTVSTFTLSYTNANGAYWGGVLSASGDIHFIPFYGSVGTKISPSKTQTTYNLTYASTVAKYAGGVMNSNGDIHMVPYSATVGQKILSGTTTTSTYTLIYTTSGAYVGGVLAPNGDIHFIPHGATVGQKISSIGVVSTYTLVFTSATAYEGGILSSTGEIHFVPRSANILVPDYGYIGVGQKIDISGVVSTYDFGIGQYGYSSGVLSSNGDMFFFPYTWTPSATILKIDGSVLNYSLHNTNSTARVFSGGVLLPNGDINVVPTMGGTGRIVSTLSMNNFSSAICQSPFFNKF